MKTKINKKYYNFTEKQKRKDTVYTKAIHFHTVGKEWKIAANQKFRRKNKEILSKIILTKKDIPFIRYRKYMWWDM